MGYERLFFVRDYTTLWRRKKDIFGLKARGVRRERLRSAGTQPRLSRQACFVSEANGVASSILAWPIPLAVLEPMPA